MYQVLVLNFNYHAHVDWSSRSLILYIILLLQAVFQARLTRVVYLSVNVVKHVGGRLISHDTWNSVNMVLQLRNPMLVHVV